MLEQLQVQSVWYDGKDGDTRIRVIDNHGSAREFSDKPANDILQNEYDNLLEQHEQVMRDIKVLLATGLQHDQAGVLCRVCEIEKRYKNA